MANNFMNKFANEAINNKIKKVGVDALTDVGSKLIKDGFSGTYKYFSNTTKKSIEDKKELNKIYEKLSNLLISTTSTFKEYNLGIEEAQGVVNLYNLKINILSKKNPAYLINKNNLVSQQNKWKTLKHSLSVDLTKKLLNECLKIYRTKTESSFLLEQTEIHNEIITCNSEEEVKEIYNDIFKRYNLNKTSAIEGLPSYKN